jgi:PTS system beta-glucosides-specific IIC component
VEAGGQYQVCIGTTVEKMYDEVVALTGKGTGAVDADDDDAPAEKMSPMDAALKFMSGVMMPLLPAIIGCGLVSSLVSILTLTGLVQSGDETYQILNGLGQVAMFFMPVLTSFVACFLITRFWPGFDPDAK